MADKRPAGFNVPIGFYDSPEVLSIPRKIRAAAVGVWTLCGAFSANKLQDGFVADEKLKELGCTPMIREALKSTRDADGPSPLWAEAPGGIRFTRWQKWQRMAVDVKAYRQAEADRKRREREAKKGARAGQLELDVDDTYEPREPYVDATYEPREPHITPGVTASSKPRDNTKHEATSDDTDMSGRTSAGHPPDVRSEGGDPKTKTKTETEVRNSPTEEHSPNVGAERGLSDPVHPTASRLVATVIPDRIPGAVRTALRIQASQLINGDHVDPDIVADALRRWLTKPGAGPGLLPALAADVIRARAAPTNGRPHKLRDIAQLAADERAREQAALPPADHPPELP